MKIKRLTSLLLAIIFVLSIMVIPVDAASLTKAQFQTKLQDAAKLYPEGTKKHSWPMGQTCHGFARWLSSYVWGVDFSNGNVAEWERIAATSTTSYIEKLKPGDVVRYKNTTGNNHTIFVTSIDGNTIHYADCNQGTPDIICWDRTISKSTLSSYLIKKMYQGGYGEPTTYGYICHYKYNNLSGSVSASFLAKLKNAISNLVTNSWSTNFKMKSGAYTNAYSGVNGSKVGRVYTNDVVTVTKVYANGWIQMSCPWDNGGSKTVYVKTNEFKFKATKYINAYGGVNGTKVGRVYPNDLVTVMEINSSGWMKCSCPWEGNTSKIIYIKTSEIY